MDPILSLLGLTPETLAAIANLSKLGAHAPLPILALRVIERPLHNIPCAFNVNNTLNAAVARLKGPDSTAPLPIVCIEFVQAKWSEMRRMIKAAVEPFHPGFDIPEGEHPPTENVEMCLTNAGFATHILTFELAQFCTLKTRELKTVLVTVRVSIADPASPVVISADFAGWKV